MKKLTLLVKTLVAASVLVMQVNVVHALPTLQLDIGGGTYNASDESTFASSQIFNLFALLDTTKNTACSR